MTTKIKCKHNYESKYDSKDNTCYYECTRCNHIQRYDDN